jgi:CubicO group peptidase (beta-lactamase class C family)
MSACRLLALAALLLTAALDRPVEAAPAGDPVRTPVPVDADRLDALVEHGMDDWGIPGIAVAVLENGEVTYAHGFGTTALEGGAPVDAHTPFANASTTKAMIAAGMLMLVDEGVLTLDDPVIDWLPEVRFADPALTPQVTIRDLLTHRTGLPSTDLWAFPMGMPLAEQIPRLAFVDPVAAPRSRHLYQNTMYELAGLVIERASGRPWPAFLRARLWRPLGMQETWANRGAIPEGRGHAQPHDDVDGRVRRVDYSLLPDVTNAAGSVWSTVTDMMRWARFLLAGGITEDGDMLLSEDAVEELFRPQSLIHRDRFPTAELTRPQWTSYGLGWFQQDFLGRKIDFHTGSLIGFVAILGLDRARSRAVMVMANRSGAELRQALLWEVMDDRAGAARPDWSAEVRAFHAQREAERHDHWQALVDGRIADAPPALPLAAYTGTFDSARSGTVTIETGGDALVLRTPVREYALTPWHAETFLLEHRDWTHGDFATFELAPDGTVEAIEVFGDVFDAE